MFLQNFFKSIWLFFTRNHFIYWIISVEDAIKYPFKSVLANSSIIFFKVFREKILYRSKYFISFTYLLNNWPITFWMRVWAAQWIEYLRIWKSCNKTKLLNPSKMYSHLLFSVCQKSPQTRAKLESRFLW